MHVCHFCDCPLTGDYFRNIAAGMTRHEVRLSLVQLGPGTAPAWLADFPQVSYTNLGAANKLSYPVATVKLARFLRENRVDLLHAHLFNAGLIAVLAKKLQRRTIVVLMRHHTGVVRMLGTRVHIAMDKWMAEQADHVVTVSEAAREYMREVDGIRCPIDVVHHGLDYELQAPDAAARRRVRAELGITDENFVVGYVGNFAPGKGHTQLIEAFAGVAEEIPGARLMLVGEGQMDDSRALASRLGLEDKVVFTGWRTDVIECMNAMDLFVQPSLSEAFSQVLIEAMGVALPVIATRVGGAAEVVTSGEHGVLVEPNDPGAIERSIRLLYHDNQLRLRMAAAGRATVSERFTVERMVAKQFELYQSWLAG